jgi:Contractile injection system tube protein
MPESDYRIPVTAAAAEIEIEGDPPPLKFTLNPSEYTISKSSSWSSKQRAGVSLPPVQYGGGAPQELSFELLLDDQEGSLDIQRDIERLFEAMDTADSAGVAIGGKAEPPRPPKVKFSWGATVSFDAAIKSLTAQYVLFHPGGQPRRAKLKLALLQLGGGVQGQNPTTRALPARGMRTVRDGDSLQSIAFDAYGNPNAWRAIAVANGLDNPLALRRGMRLAIPELDG